MVARGVEVTVQELTALIEEATNERPLYCSYLGGTVYNTAENQWALLRIAEMRGIDVTDLT